MPTAAARTRIVTIDSPSRIAGCLPLTILRRAFFAGAGLMTSDNTGTISRDLRALYEDYTSGAIDRRSFMRRAVALGAGGAAASALGSLAASVDAVALAQETTGSAA